MNCRVEVEITLLERKLYYCCSKLPSKHPLRIQIYGLLTDSLVPVPISFLTRPGAIICVSASRTGQHFAALHIQQTYN